MQNLCTAQRTPSHITKCLSYSRTRRASLRLLQKEGVLPNRFPLLPHKNSFALDDESVGLSWIHWDEKNWTEQLRKKTTDTNSNLSVNAILGVIAEKSSSKISLLSNFLIHLYFFQIFVHPCMFDKLSKTNTFKYNFYHNTVAIYNETNRTSSYIYHLHPFAGFALRFAHWTESYYMHDPVVNLNKCSCNPMPLHGKERFICKLLSYTWPFRIKLENYMVV